MRLVVSKITPSIIAQWTHQGMFILHSDACIYMMACMGLLSHDWLIGVEVFIFIFSHLLLWFYLFPFEVDVTTGILNIRNISQFEFGTYQCNASNVVGSSVCTLELSSGSIQNLNLNMLKCSVDSEYILGIFLT